MAADAPHQGEGPKRLGEPHEDDLEVQGVEIRFAVPVFIPQEAMRDLHDWVSAVVQLAANQIENHHHWVSGYGSKPLWNRFDRAFLGLPEDPNAPQERGEPEFDDTIIEISTAAREKYPHEIERERRKANEA